VYSMFLSEILSIILLISSSDPVEAMKMSSMNISKWYRCIGGLSRMGRIISNMNALAKKTEIHIPIAVPLVWWKNFLFWKCM